MSNSLRKIKRNIAVSRGLPRNALNPSGIKLRLSQMRAAQKLQDLMEEQRRLQEESPEDGKDGS